MHPVIIDVREKDEFEAEHIENAIHLPLSELGQKGPAIFNMLQDRKVVLMCRSGQRARLAAAQLARLGFPGELCEIYPGGILKWKEDGKPTRAVKSRHLPILRQVQLIAGLLALIGSVLALTIDYRFALLPAAVGAGLTIAGATGFCFLANVLSLFQPNATQE